MPFLLKVNISRSPDGMDDEQALSPVFPNVLLADEMNKNISAGIVYNIKHLCVTEEKFCEDSYHRSCQRWKDHDL